MNFNPNFYRLFLLITFSIITHFSLAFNTINYNAQNGIVKSSIRKVFIDNTNRVWIGTENGLSVLSSNGIKNIIFDKSWDNNQIWEIYQTPDSTIWLGCLNGSIYYYKNYQFSTLQNQQYINKRIVRKIHFDENKLFIGTDSGLYVMDYKTKDFIKYNTDFKNQIQIMNIFRFKKELYFQSFGDGFFHINIKTKSFQKVENNKWIKNAIFGSIVSGDTLIFSTQYISPQNKLQYKIYRTTGEFFENKKLTDSLAYNTLAWKFTKAENKIFAACWGVHDPSGGLLEITKTNAIKRSTEYGITSDNLWGINYDLFQNKLYVASLDKGIFIVDLNAIVKKSNIQTNQANIIKNINGKLYLLSDSTLSIFKNNVIINSINFKSVDEYLRKEAKHRKIQFIEHMSTLFNDLVDFNGLLGLVTNKGVVFLDNNLIFKNTYRKYGAFKITKINQQDFLLTTDYYTSELVRNLGKDRTNVFSVEDTNNPVNVIGSCIIDDSLSVYVSYTNNLYLYNQNNKKFRKLSKQSHITMPCMIENVSSNNLVFLDRSNKLFSGKFIKNDFEFKLLNDFGKKGVVEGYFCKAIDNNIFIGTNQGLYVISGTKTYLINKYLGIPENSILKSIDFHDGLYYLATTDGVFTVDLNQLKKLDFDYKIDNANYEINDHILNFKMGERISLNEIPKTLTLHWEINRHPYPQNIEYYYKLNQDTIWQKVVKPGEIVLSNPNYGNNNMFLKIYDKTNDKTLVVKLTQISINRPFYKSELFLTILLILLISTVLIIYYRMRIRKIRNAEQKAKKESVEFKQKLEIIQYLLKPHFIFNVLTSIQNLIIEKDFDRSLKYSGYFSKLLRGVLDSSEDGLIPLKDEIVNIDNYIRLEKLRFNDNLLVHFEIDEHIDIDNTYTIPFLLQPLVENTFKHAFNNIDYTPELSIIIQKNADSIHYVVSDNGRGISGQNMEELLSKTKSKGLKIIQSQLKRFYPNRHSFYLEKNSNRGISWKIIL